MYVFFCFLDIFSEIFGRWLQEKTGGLIIHRHGGQILLYRGRRYNAKKRPRIPLMLWKPHEPIYPRLIKTVIEGLTIGETKEMRKRGLAVPALTKLGDASCKATISCILLICVSYFLHFCSEEWILC